MAKFENIFQKSKINKADSARIEQTLTNYMSQRYPWLEFISGRVSYAVRQYKFHITVPDFVNTKLRNEMAKNLDIVLDTENCEVTSKGSKLIVNIPRNDRNILYFHEGISEFMKMKPGNISCYVGEYADGNPVIIDFKEIPHLLIAGASNSGKTICLYNVLLSIAGKYSPDEVQFYILDDKRELTPFKDLPHTKDAAFSKEDINGLISEIKLALDHRKEELADYQSDIYAYEDITGKKLPHYFIIFDEADSVIKRDSTNPTVATHVRSIIQEATAQGRSLGIHIIIASQKPSGKNIDTDIKSNITNRICLRVANKSDSRVILDENGAEKLSGKGDALFKHEEMLNHAQGIYRLQCAFTTQAEHKAAIDYLKAKYGSKSAQPTTPMKKAKKN